MLRWIPYVMVRIAVCFAAGIVVAIYFPILISLSFAVRLFLILLLLYFSISRISRTNDFRILASGCVGLFAVFLAGYLSLLYKSGFNDPTHFSTVPSFQSYAGTLGVPERKLNSTKVEIYVYKIYTNAGWVRVSGKVLLYLDTSAVISYSDRIIVNGQPTLIPGPINPGAFDYRNYLRQKNIAHHQRLQRNSYAIITMATDNGIQFYAQQARAWATKRIVDLISEPRAQAITLALVLGTTSGLDNELLDAYSASGAMHVLSVSGLHVGIIYAIVLLLLKPLRYFSWSKWLVAAVSLMCLWAYAFVTGLSPSVLRAVMMFSFIVIAGPFGRNSNIINTLAASAFLLLLMNPWLVLSVGFQLSYLAVAGIVLLQRPLYEMFEAKTRVGDKIWQITSVSIAAQLATFPLGLFYFHQFPVYFLISNMLVIPLSTAVLVAGIVLLVVSPFLLLAKCVAWIIQLLVLLLNKSVFIIEDLPGSVLDGVQINFLQCCLLSLFLIVGILFLSKRKLHYAFVATGILLLFGTVDWIRFYRDIGNDQMIVYGIQGHSAFERIRNGKSVCYADSAVISDPRSIRNNMLPFRVASGVTSVRTTMINDNDTAGCFRYLKWKNTTVLFVDKRTVLQVGPLEVDYLIIGHNAMPSLATISSKIRFKRLILDNSNGQAYIDRILEEASQSNIDVYSIRDRGAFITQL